MPRKKDERQLRDEDGERLLTPAVDYYLTRLSELVSIAAVMEEPDEKEVERFIEWACRVAPGADQPVSRRIG